MGFLDDITGGSILNAGLSLINGSMNRNAQKQINREQIAWAREALQTQQAFAKEMFNLENEYNTPQNQAIRLAAAGINPAAAYSQGMGDVGNGAGSASLSPITPNLGVPESPFAGMVGARPFEMLNSILDAAKKGKDIKLFDATFDDTVKRLGLDVENLALKNEYQTFENDWKEYETMLNKKWSDKERKQAFDMGAQKINNLIQEAALNALAGDKLKAETALKELEAITEKWKGKQLQTDFAFRVSYWKSYINNLNSQTSKNNAEANQISELLPYMKKIKAGEIKQIANDVKQGRLKTEADVIDLIRKKFNLDESADKVLIQKVSGLLNGKTQDDLYNTLMNTAEELEDFEKD